MKTTTQVKPVIGIPFVSHVNQENRPVLDNPIEFIKRAYLGGYFTNSDNIFRYGVYKNMGYRYDLTTYLKKYLYRQYGQWSEIYAPNKTAVRKVIYGRIDKIIELI